MTLAVECRHVKKTVFGEGREEEILSIPSFLVQAGEQVALMGPSGSGKSTLLHLLAGLLLPTSGEIWIFGDRIDRMTERERDRLREKQIGLVFQQFLLFSYLTVMENLLIRGLQDRAASKKDQEEKASYWLEKVGLTHRINQSVKTLSRGEKQRVAVARALYQEPSLLLVDEPTSSLDAAKAFEIMNLLIRLSKEKGITLILVTHDRTMAEMIPRRVEMAELNASYKANAKRNQ